jgi:chromosome segregation ATPase
VIVKGTEEMSETRRVSSPSAIVAVIAPLLIAFATPWAVIATSASRPTQSPQTQTTQNGDENETLRRRVRELTSEVNRLKQKVAELEKYKQIDYIRDLLTKEEQRAEALQTQLLELSEKEATVQSRLDEVEDQLRPESIDRNLAGIGSTRPEDTREAVQRRLGNERRRLQSQADLLRQSRARLQTSLAGTDASIQRLRMRLTDATK